MTFFHDLNKRLAALASKQDAKQLSESKKIEAVAQSPLTKALNESSNANVEKQRKDDMTKAMKFQGMNDRQVAYRHKKMADAEKAAAGENVKEAGYSAKAGRAGKDLGKPGKNFAKIAKGAAERYGSKAAGERVAGAVLNKLRHPKEDVAQEGNAFTGALAKTPKGGKFKVGGKEFTDNSDLEEGFADMDAWLAKREKEKGTGKFDRKERTLPGGMKATTYTRRHDDEADDEEVSTEPKRRGRPAGPKKAPERVTKGAWKHKGERKVKAEENLDTGGVMMTRPTNCSSESAADDSAIKSAIKLLKKNGYNVSKKEEVEEKAVSKAQQKFMGMVHAAQKGEKPASKEVAKVAKEMPKKAAKDFAATKHKGLPEKVKAKKEESKEEVEETTTAGSVATTTTAPKASKGMQFGKGVYEGLDRQFNQALTESISVESKMEECDMGGQSITIQADGEEAAKLMALLKLAGLEGCPACGKAPCGCESLEENSPDWPTDAEKIDADPNLRTYSGGLNGPKSTGQTTTPVIASQLRRQASMEESVKLEKTLSDLYKNYKG